MDAYKALHDFLKDKGLEAYYVAVVILSFFFIWAPAYPHAALLTSSFFFAFMPFVLPVLLFKLTLESWTEYQQEKDYYETKHSLLEIKLPEEITQTPLAAELMMRALYQTGEVDRNVDGWFYGKTRPWFSLEIVSTEGVIHFYIWTRTRYRQLVETQIYAHYPTAQVVEVEDYTLKVPYDPAVIDVWGIGQALQKPDPYPIVTYVELGLDKLGTEEEYKHDPLASMLELMGSMKKGEHIWIQIIIRAQWQHECPWAEEKTGHEMTFAEWAEYETEKIGAKYAKKDNGEPINYMGLSEGDKGAIKAIDQKLNKQAFDTGIRAVYVARKEVSNSVPRAGMPSAFRSFEHGSEGRGLNGLKPIFYIGPFLYFWQDFMGMRKAMLKRKLYRSYVRRLVHHAPYRERTITLNSEELATIYHFPGQVVRTPTLERLQSRRGEAPSNLPV